MSKNFSHITFFVAEIKTIYFAFVNNNATIVYVLDYQLTRPLFSINIKPKVNFFII